MKYVIDIPQSYYEQIQEYPQQIWIGRDIIKPLQTELEEIKAEIDDLKCYTMEAEFRDKVLDVIDNHIKE